MLIRPTDIFCNFARNQSFIGVTIENVLHPLHTTVQPPRRFTFPFCYEPHELCRMAAAEVRRHIETAGGWREEANRGKMFGVLVVKTPDGRTAFVAAYSGLLGGRCDRPWFVPPVFDSQQPDGHFKTREAEISEINRQVDELEKSAGRRLIIGRKEEAQRKAEAEIAEYKKLMAEAKRRRHEAREQNGNDATLTRESQHMKAELRRIKQRHAEKISRIETELKETDARIEALKRRRHLMSDELQRWLFDRYAVLNARGERRTLTDIFAEATGRIPPSGAGDCCAPKLLQYAYLHHLRPLCMAEFWWGESPRAELRRHLHYYPACRGKCKPILEHMLQGLSTDPDPLAEGREGEEPEIVYEDRHIAVLLKPAGMLTVPGKGCRDSVLGFMRRQWPEAEGPVIVHRLDMDTSGLLVVAKTTAAYHRLQEQFRERTVSKTYTALLQGCPTLPRPRFTARPRQGTISLPLRPDPLDRPRQCVDRERGRHAVTEYRILSVNNGRTLIELHPLTGRTHQLRVHCAHPDGLDTPILGDPLYGQPADRLYLHAARIEFTHPATGRRMMFERKAEWTV